MSPFQTATNRRDCSAAAVVTGWLRWPPTAELMAVEHNPTSPRGRGQPRYSRRRGRISQSHHRRGDGQDDSTTAADAVDAGIVQLAADIETNTLAVAGAGPYEHLSRPALSCERLLSTR